MRHVETRLPLCLLLGLIVLCSGGRGDDSPTWIEVGGRRYGAQPDAIGPIGGGEGYTAWVEAPEHQVRTVDELLAALEVASAGQTVFLPGDAVIDLTARILIDRLVLRIPAGVTLAGDRGREGSPGALLVSRTLETRPMIEALGPGVRITGLRIVGPDPGRHLDHHRRSFVEGYGREYFYRLPASIGIWTEHHLLEVDNCDLSGFSHAGIYLARGKGHRIHHNEIHHCQRQGLGYGVCLDVAVASIQRNRFDSNRHSIAGTGRPGSGYDASHNVEMGISLGHCFDMHGGRDRQDGTDVAGSKITIVHNTFRAPQTPVLIRGTPEEFGKVEGNWFVQHYRPSRAVRSSGRTEVRGNAYGPRAATGLD